MEGSLNHGVLWTWTVQRFEPKSPPYEVPPGGFQPFPVGYVELSTGERILAVLDVEPDTLRIGMPLTVEASTGVPHAHG